MNEEYYYQVKEIFDRAKSVNPNFDNLTTQQQYEFINNNLNEELEKDEIVFYYNYGFGWPYNSKEYLKIKS